jgi:hypothetical protein
MTSYHSFSKCIYFSDNLVADVVDDELKKTFAFILKIEGKNQQGKNNFLIKIIGYHFSFLWFRFMPNYSYYLVCLQGYHSSIR